MRYLTEFAGRFQGFAQEESASAAAFSPGSPGRLESRCVRTPAFSSRTCCWRAPKATSRFRKRIGGKFLDEWMAGWQRKAEEMIGQGGDARSDDERAAEIRADAREDMTRERDTDRIPDLDGKAAERFIGFWQSDVDSASTPREQGQIIRFLDDLRVHLAKPPGA